jgi:hypothetical protein
MSFVTSRRIVFSRSTAWLLIALVTLPFTAPFSTCDLSMLMSVVSHASSRVVIGHGGRSSSIEEASVQDATASVLEEEQFKDTMLTAAVTIAPTSAQPRPVQGTGQRASAHRLPLVALRL